MSGIKSSKYEWLSESSWGDTERNWLVSGRYNFACNLFRPLKPLRVKGVFSMPEQKLWLFRQKDQDISGVAMFQKTVRGANNWLLFARPEPVTETVDEALLFRALKSMVSQVLMARKVPVLSIVAEGDWLSAAQELFKEDPSGNDDGLLTSIWSPRLDSDAENFVQGREMSDPGVFLPCYRTTADLWFQAFPDAKSLPELASLNRLSRLKQDSAREQRPGKKPGGFMRGLFRFAGRSRRP